MLMKTSNLISYATMCMKRNGLRKNDSALPYLESTRESVVIKSPNSSGYGLRTGAPGRRWSVWIRNNSRFQYRPMPRPFDPGSLHPAPAWRLQQEQAAWIARLAPTRSLKHIHHAGGRPQWPTVSIQGRRSHENAGRNHIRPRPPHDPRRFREFAAQIRHSVPLEHAKTKSTA